MTLAASDKVFLSKPVIRYTTVFPLPKLFRELKITLDCIELDLANVVSFLSSANKAKSTTEFFTLFMFLGNLRIALGYYRSYQAPWSM